MQLLVLRPNNSDFFFFPQYLSPELNTWIWDIYLNKQWSSGVIHHIFVNLSEEKRIPGFESEGKHSQFLAVGVAGPERLHAIFLMDGNQWCCDLPALQLTVNGLKAAEGGQHLGGNTLTNKAWMTELTQVETPHVPTELGSEIEKPVAVLNSSLLPFLLLSLPNWWTYTSLFH